MICNYVSFNFDRADANLEHVPDNLVGLFQMGPKPNSSAEQSIALSIIQLSFCIHASNLKRPWMQCMHDEGIKWKIVVRLFPNVCLPKNFE